MNPDQRLTRWWVTGKTRAAAWSWWRCGNVHVVGYGEDQATADSDLAIHLRALIADATKAIDALEAPPR